MIRQNHFASFKSRKLTYISIKSRNGNGNSMLTLIKYDLMLDN